MPSNWLIQNTIEFAIALWSHSHCEAEIQLESAGHVCSHKLRCTTWRMRVINAVLPCMQFICAFYDNVHMHMHVCMCVSVCVVLSNNVYFNYKLDVGLLLLGRILGSDFNCETQPSRGWRLMDLLIVD